MTDRPDPSADSPESIPDLDLSDKTFGIVGASESTGTSRRDTSIDSSLAHGTILSAEMPALPKSGSNILSPDSATAVWIGQYCIIGELGRGGMGTVHKVRHRVMPRIAALKMILQGDLAGEEQRRRFEIDAAALATLEHDSIVRMYEYGEHNRNPYFVMEYIDGGSLADHLREEPAMEFARAASLVRKLARGVAYAHQKGIVHRDLKPGNILLTKHGLPKITDFGLARMASEHNSMAANNGQPLTPDGQVMGTPAYMAPEQASGVSDASDHRVDIYSLGAILYELLAGRPPFKGNQMEILRLLWGNTDPTPLADLRPDVPADLEAICRKCMERDPSARYFSATELVADLECLESGLPNSGAAHQAPSAVLRQHPSSASHAPAPLSGAVVSRPGFVRRNAKTLAVAGLLVMAVGGWFGYGEIAASGLRNKARKEVAEAEAAYSNLDRSEALRHYGNAFETLGRLRERDPESARFRYESADVLYHKGKISCELRNWDSAEKDFKRALEEFDGNGEAGNGFRSELLRAEIHHYLGVLIRDRQVSDYAEGRRNVGASWDSFNTAKLIREVLNGKKMSLSPDMQQKLDRDLARSHGYMGDAEVYLGKMSRAEESYKASLQVRRKLAQDYPGELDFQLQCARGEQNFYTLYREQNRLPEAKAASLRALAWLTPHIDAPGVLSDILRDYVSNELQLAEVTMDLGEREGVADELARARRVCDRLAKAAPDDASVLSLQLQLELDAAKCDFVRGESAAALAKLSAGRAILKRFPKDKLQPGDRINGILMDALGRELTADADEKREILSACRLGLKEAHGGGFNAFVGFQHDVAGKTLMASPAFKKSVDEMLAESFPKDED